MATDTSPTQRHRHEPHASSHLGRLNWLRAGVLGANDGILSTAGLVVGVAAATSDRGEIATAGVAGLVAGAVSMAVGEYVSVSTQRDSENALIAKEAAEIEEMPEAEHKELVGLLRARGLKRETAHIVADEMTEHDALGAHLELELGIDPHSVANPWIAAFSSFIAFTIGALLPLLAVLLPPAESRIAVAFVSVLVGLCITGYTSATLGKSSPSRAVFRLVAGGAIAMAVTFGVGSQF